jgi:arabinose-5-phosphate isomerase
MSAKKFGTLIVLDSKKRLKGTYSDGDSRRDSGKNFKKLKVKDLMTKKPITIEKNVLAVNCLRLMQNNKITKVIVAKKDRVEGLISIHHIIDSGIR